MRLHAYRHRDGSIELVCDDALVTATVHGALDLGLADVDLATCSPALVLSVGLTARAMARGADALVVEHAIATRDAPRLSVSPATRAG